IATAVVLLVTGLCVSGMLYYLALEQKERAETAVRLEYEVNRFLNEDVLGFADPSSAGQHDLSVRALLEAAESRLDQSFEGQDAARAKLSLTLGRSYYGLGL